MGIALLRTNTIKKDEKLMEFLEENKEIIEKYSNLEPTLNTDKENYYFKYYIDNIWL